MSDLDAPILADNRSEGRLAVPALHVTPSKFTLKGPPDVRNVGRW